MRAAVVERLVRPVRDRTSLRSRVMAALLSNQKVQASAMWLVRLTQKTVGMVREMDQHTSSHMVQLSAIKALSSIYGNIKLKPQAAEALPAALSAVIKVMEPTTRMFVFESTIQPCIGSISPESTRVRQRCSGPRLHVVNLNDYHGEVEFSSELTAGLRVTDGSIAVNCDGCAVQIDACFRQGRNNGRRSS